MQVIKRARDVVITLITLVPAIVIADRIDGELIIACSKEADDARRLACYDGVVLSAETPNEQSPRHSSGNTQSTSPHAPMLAVPAEDEFGLEGSEAAKQRRAQQAQSKEAQGLRSLTAAVTQVSTEPHGQLVITLENAQVWKQKTPESYFPIKVGDRVTINAGLLGSYRMINGKRSTQVTRVK